MRLNTSSLQSRQETFINMSSAKITKQTGRSRNESEMVSKLKAHNEQLEKLQAERDELVEKKKIEGVLNADDEAKSNTIENAISKYTGAKAQVTPTPESSAATESHATEQHTTEQHTTEQHTTDQHTTDQHTTDEHTTEQHATVNAPEPATKHVNDRESPSKYGEIKREPAEESKMTTNRYVDDLGMAWDVDVNDTHVELALQNQNKEAIGHIMRTSQARYCVGYGSADARSARFESTLPDGSKYQGTRDVTKRSNRIVERIVQFHKDKKEALPMDILSRVKVLLVYWDSKVGIGHAAEVDVLAPDFAKRRPHTRCFIYLDPALYTRYNIENKTGYSHETRSTMKPLMEGNDDWQKSITLHNIAVRLENKFEEKCMSGVSGRPEPLHELVHEREVASRRSRSRYTTAEPSASPTPMKPPISPRQPTPRQPTPRQPTPRQPTPRQPTPPQETRHEQAPTGAKPGMSPKQRFHMEYLELFDLAENVTYADLTEQQQLLYPAQFTKWKAVNS
jgi:hypothetical protein